MPLAGHMSHSRSASLQSLYHHRSAARSCWFSKRWSRSTCPRAFGRTLLAVCCCRGRPVTPWLTGGVSRRAQRRPAVHAPSPLFLTACARVGESALSHGAPAPHGGPYLLSHGFALGPRAELWLMPRSAPKGRSGVVVPFWWPFLGFALSPASRPSAQATCSCPGPARCAGTDLAPRLLWALVSPSCAIMQGPTTTLCIDAARYTKW